ncbi:hypothetical protein ACLB2K_045045 [Fragaria x ananassa]
MVDEVSRLAATLAILESGQVSFSAAGVAAFSRHSYAGKLQIKAQGERYVLRFNDVENRKAYSRRKTVLLSQPIVRASGPMEFAQSASASATQDNDGAPYPYQ